MVIAWSDLTDVQADAVHATAVRHLLDPEEVLADVGPLLTREPEPRTVVFEENVVADVPPAWSPLPVEGGATTVLFRAIPPVPPSVKEMLTV